MNVYKLFPTTVIEFDLRGYPNKQNLLNYIQNFNSKDHSLISNGKSSHGYDDILFNKNFQDLNNKISECIQTYTNYLELEPNSILESWFNILENGGSTESHHHFSSVISGAYYPLLKDNTCDLIFNSPLYSSIAYCNNTNHNNPNFYYNFQMPIKQDYLYLFPGWLEHKTEVNRGERRIVISFNTKFNKN